MSLPDVLLSLLRQPMSGTELIQLFEGSIGHFWQTDLSQIYRALESLEKAGRVRSRSEPSSRGPARRVYSLTDRGNRRLKDWLRQPPRPPRAKFEYLAQLFSMTAEERPSERASTLLREMRVEAARAVATLEAIDGAFHEVPGYPGQLPAHVFYPWLTLRHGLLRRRAFLEWIDEALALLDQRDDRSDPAQGAAAMAELLEAMAAFGPDGPFQTANEEGSE